MIITISGNPGSGKSTVSKILVREQGYERIYAGGIMRDMARERNITLEQLMLNAKTDPKIDEEVDHRVRDKARELSASGKDVIVEGRVQFYHIPESIKIYINVDEKSGAERIWKDLQDKEISQARNQEAASSIEEVIHKNRVREEGDAQRYLKLYGVDHRDKSNYDKVIDTTNITADEAADRIIQYLQNQQ